MPSQEKVLPAASGIAYEISDPREAPRSLEWLWTLASFTIPAYLVTLSRATPTAAPGHSSLLGLFMLGFGTGLVWLVAEWAAKTTALPGGTPWSGRLAPILMVGDLCLMMSIVQQTGNWLTAAQIGLTTGVAASLLVSVSAAGRSTRSLAAREHWRDLFQMTKPGLNALVLASTLVGFVMGSRGAIDWPLGLRAMIGTWLVAGGASVLNQVIERHADARMARTAGRPLPTGRLSPSQALAFGCLIALAGLALLAIGVNLLTAWLAALSLGVYLFIYTPLKRINSLSTLAGAISGAIPPLMGWTAAADEIGAVGQTLFFIQFLWQIPHFLAIAWKYREQYRAAGFPLLAVIDREGRATSRQALLYAVALAFVALLPYSMGATTMAYSIGAGVLSCGFITCGLLFARRPAAGSARRLFLASIIYLPLLMGLLIACRR